MSDPDREALFKTWLAAHNGVILKVARAYTLTAEDRQDLVQEILLQIWSSLPQFQGKANAATWCYRVALNTALGWHHQERRRRVRQQPIFVGDDPAVEGTDSAEQAAERDQVDQLYAAIHQLSPTDTALVLLYLDDLSYRQMAEVLGISESNVGVKLHRAKKALNQLLEQRDEF